MSPNSELDLAAIEATLDEFDAAWQGSAIFADRASFALDYYIQPETIRALVAALRAAEAEIAIDNQLLADRQRILDALPCPEHGACVPYVLAWIEKHKAAT